MKGDNGAMNQQEAIQKLNKWYRRKTNTYAAEWAANFYAETLRYKLQGDDIQWAVKCTHMIVDELTRKDTSDRTH